MKAFCHLFVALLSVILCLLISTVKREDGRQQDEHPLQDDESLSFTACWCVPLLRANDASTLVINPSFFSTVLWMISLV